MVDNIQNSVIKTAVSRKQVLIKASNSPSQELK